jgi:hypothetical protein
MSRWPRFLFILLLLTAAFADAWVPLYLSGAVPRGSWEHAVFIVCLIFVLILALLLAVFDS